MSTPTIQLLETCPRWDRSTPIAEHRQRIADWKRRVNAAYAEIYAREMGEPSPRTHLCPYCEDSGWRFYRQLEGMQPDFARCGCAVGTPTQGRFGFPPVEPVSQATLAVLVREALDMAELRHWVTLRGSAQQCRAAGYALACEIYDRRRKLVLEGAPVYVDLSRRVSWDDHTARLREYDDCPALFCEGIRWDLEGWQIKMASDVLWEAEKRRALVVLLGITVPQVTDVGQLSSEWARLVETVRGCSEGRAPVVVGR